VLVLFTPPTPDSTEVPGANPTQTRDGAICRPRFRSPPEGGQDGDDDGSGSAEGSGGGALDVSCDLRVLLEKGLISLAGSSCPSQTSGGGGPCSTRGATELGSNSCLQQLLMVEPS
ncbi:unnamed protein product, partial [Ectocarpus sp. 8 AP-2014]